eukprot:7319691-Ditylum_brightwellii.AAC.1
MLFYIRQKVWAKPSGHGYHCATIVNGTDNGAKFLTRWRKQHWDDSVICARNLRPLIKSQCLVVTMHGIMYHGTDMAGGVPH